MRISLLQISLMRFFKTFQNDLANVFLSYLFHFCDFLAKNSQKIAVMKELIQKTH